MKENRFLEQLEFGLSAQGKIERPNWGQIFTIIGIVVFAVCSGIYAYSLMVGEPLPPSLNAAGFATAEKPWSDDRLKLAVKITRASLKNGEAVLINADKNGDAAAAVPLFNLVTYTMRAWDSQPAGDIGGRYRGCVLAAMHLGDGAQAVWQGGSFTSQARFRTAIEDCE